MAMLTATRAVGVGEGMRGITLVEMMIVIAVAGVLLALAGPSFYELIRVQRLRGVAEQLTTDLQFARTEAATRNEMARFRYQTDSTRSCYVIFTSPDNARRCTCLGSGPPCTDSLTREIKTVIVASSTGVKLVPPSGQAFGFAFSPVNGGIVTVPTDSDSQPMPQYRLFAELDANRRLMAEVNQAGRVMRCQPTGSTVKDRPC